MKRCPTCNQTFSEEWLSFCTRDGTSLVDTSALSQDPPPTVMAPPMPPSVSPSEQPTINLPGSGGFSQSPAPYTPPAPIQSGWAPPPPPLYAAKPKQGLAIASLSCGIFSITLGWCCSIGLITSLVAIALGIVSLVQIKNNPDQNTGKPLAIAGILTAAAYLAFWVLIILIWGFGTLLQGVK